MGVKGKKNKGLHNIRENSHIGAIYQKNEFFLWHLTHQLSNLQSEKKVVIWPRTKLKKIF